MPESMNPMTLKWRRRSFGLDSKTAEGTELLCPSCEETNMVSTFVHNKRALVCPECGSVQPVVSGAFETPKDAWRSLNKTKQAQPVFFEGRFPLWSKVAARIGHDPGKGVVQQYPVIGGRRRYHHRPLSSWKMSNGRTLTLTTDELEAKTWNRLKGKHNAAFPKIHDVFSVTATGADPVWAIVHEEVNWPVPADWDFFVDQFFRWRAMQHGGLAPASMNDINNFLRYILDPEVANPLTLKRARTEQVLPWKMTKGRRKEADTTRTQLLRDPTVQEKIQWAKAALKFLDSAQVKFRDFDPSNLGLTKSGNVVVTNLAESRSKPNKTGRMGRIKGSTLSGLLETASAINILLEGAPVETLHVLSGETRYLLTLIHGHSAARAVVLQKAGMEASSSGSLKEGMDYISQLATQLGGKATKLLKKLKG